jgi:response regulator RpfG family c-di-GMP phosphodiesterase
MDDLLIFAEETHELPQRLFDPWKILIIDDEQDVHAITELVLRGFVFESRALEFFHAYSAAQAYEILQKTDDIAMAFVDVVMETEHAGLDLVRDIREKLDNKLLRLVLRTGQPGQAPEESVIVEYDINDYKAKTELTAIKLKTTLYAALRSYRDLKTIDSHKKGLERVINSLTSITQKINLTDITSAILFETAQVLGLKNDAAYVSVLSKHHDGTAENYTILASIGEIFNDSPTLDALSDDVKSLFNQALASRTSIHDGDHYVAYIAEDNGNENLLYVSKYTPLDELDIYLLEVFANNVAIAFHNTLLREEIEAGRQELVYILGEAVESRSKETGSHVKRVGEISAILGQKYGLNEHECHLLKLAAPLHDAGKIAIPDSVLNKPNKLDSQERSIMNTHAQAGYELLCKSTSSVLQHAAIIAQEHHEFWDGNGYPSGKKGENIHLYARIAGVVDVFDALGSKRCYKEAWAIEEIIEYISQGSGKQFEPKLVDLLITNLTEICEVRNHFPDKAD